MEECGGDMALVQIVAFGPLAEILGWKEKTIPLPGPTTPFLVIEFLGIEDWANGGLTYYVDGEMCDAHSVLPEKCELALLPPVSGG